MNARRDEHAGLRAAARDASVFELLRAWEHARSGKPRSGGAGPAGEEVVRLRGHVGPGFPIRDVHDVEVLPDGRLRVDVTFLTLLGHDAPLPDHDVLAVLRAPDERARDFLDLFGHRLLSLLYAAWARTRPDVGEPARRLIRALIDPSGRGEAAWVPPLPAGRRGGAVALERAVSARLGGVPVRVEPCVVQRVDIPEDQRTRLGVRNSRLGTDAMLGARAWSATGRFRLHVGPVDAATALALRPGGASHRTVVSVVRDRLPAPLDWTLVVDVPADQLGCAVLGGAVLGVDTWLGRPRTAVVTLEIPPVGEEDP